MLASWTGYGNTLRLQNLEIDEIDIFCANAALSRRADHDPKRLGSVFFAIEPWRARRAESEGRHRRDDLTLTFAPSPRWEEAPALLKRLLKQLRRSAEGGLIRLEGLDDIVQRIAATIGAQHRPGKLVDLGRFRPRPSLP